MELGSWRPPPVVRQKTSTQSTSTLQVLEVGHDPRAALVCPLTVIGTVPHSTRAVVRRRDALAQREIAIKRCDAIRQISGNDLLEVRIAFVEGQLHVLQRHAADIADGDIELTGSHLPGSDP